MNPPVPAKLRPVIARLEAGAGRPDLEELRRLLQQLDLSPEGVRDFISFNAGGYQRNLVSCGAWHEILVICWLSGQRSPIHDHAGSACAFKVLHGTDREIIHQLQPDGSVRPLCSRRLPPGYVAASREADIHEVANLQPQQRPLITLHIYSPPLVRMRTYHRTYAPQVTATALHSTPSP